MQCDNSQWKKWLENWKQINIFQKLTHILFVIGKKRYAMCRESACSIHTNARGEPRLPLGAISQDGSRSVPNRVLWMALGIHQSLLSEIKVVKLGYSKSHSQCFSRHSPLAHRNSSVLIFSTSAAVPSSMLLLVFGVDVVGSSVCFVSSLCFTCGYYFTLILFNAFVKLSWSLEHKRVRSSTHTTAHIHTENDRVLPFLIFNKK